jgi:hypothetical protein
VENNKINKTQKNLQKVQNPILGKICPINPKIHSQWIGNPIGEVALS